MKALKWQYIQKFWKVMWSTKKNVLEKKVVS